jgi:hypothetical protein
MFGNGLHLIVPPTSYAQWLEELRVPLPPAEPDLFIDWAGVRTRTGMLPWAPDGPCRDHQRRPADPVRRLPLRG